MTLLEILALAEDTRAKRVRETLAAVRREEEAKSFEI